MAASQISTSVTIINSLLGFQAISLSNMTTSAATAITAGSKVEIASAFFNFTTDTTPSTTAWTAITTGNTAYITLTPSGTAGSQILTASWSETAPEWSDSKQGWYLTAGSTIRYVGGCYKSGTSSYEHKFVLVPSAQEKQTRAMVSVEVLNIGDWNMDSTATVAIAHGLPDFNKIVRVSAVVRNDDGNAVYTISGDATSNLEAWVGLTDATNINLVRKESGSFDSVNFDATSYNRGRVMVEWIPASL